MIKAGPALRQAFLLVGYNPSVRAARGDEAAALGRNRAKKRHVRLVARHFGVAVEECLLLDDVEDNVRDTDGCRAVLVDGGHGFRLSDLDQLLP
jgi:hypothetical protein